MEHGADRREPVKDLASEFPLSLVSRVIEKHCQTRAHWAETSTDPVAEATGYRGSRFGLLQDNGVVGIAERYSGYFIPGKDARDRGLEPTRWLCIATPAFWVPIGAWDTKNATLIISSATRRDREKKIAVPKIYQQLGARAAWNEYYWRVNLRDGKPDKLHFSQPGDIGSKPVLVADRETQRRAQRQLTADLWRIVGVLDYIKTLPER